MSTLVRSGHPSRLLVPFPRLRNAFNSQTTLSSSKGEDGQGNAGNLTPGNQTPGMVSDLISATRLITQVFLPVKRLTEKWSKVDLPVKRLTEEWSKVDKGQ